MLLALLMGFGLVSASAAETPLPASEPTDVIDGAIHSEHAMISSLKKLHPMVETYVQEVKLDAELGPRPSHDHYLLGRLDLSRGINEKSYIPISAFKRQVQKLNLLSWSLNMSGWAQMAIMDLDSFDRNHYQFTYIKREFLGEVRCVVFDVQPKSHSGTGRFVGRIWVEDQAFNIVRFGGTYVHPKHGRDYVHFDSWRLNVSPGLWLPAEAYAEESALPVALHKKVRFKAQIRFWGYQLHDPAKESEFTNLTIESPENGANEVSDKTTDVAAVSSLRQWERQATDNVLARLEKGGFLAPKGPVDQVLETVVNNLVVTNDLNLDPPVSVRILITTPFESFTVGRTIVISKGLVDVLPDEASLAAVLAHELAHIVLYHQLDTKFAFEDRFFFDDEKTIKNLQFVRHADEEAAADAKAIQFLQKSPYGTKLAETGLFLRQLSAQAEQMPNLIRPLLGNKVADSKRGTRDLRLSGLMETAPPLREADTKQVSALPLGSRIKTDPWTDELSLIKAQPVAIQTPKEKLPFEVIPLALHLTRLPAASASATPAQPTK